MTCTTRCVHDHDLTEELAGQRPSEGGLDPCPSCPRTDGTHDPACPHAGELIERPFVSPWQRPPEANPAGPTRDRARLIIAQARAAGDALDFGFGLEAKIMAALDERPRSDKERGGGAVVLDEEGTRTVLEMMADPPEPTPALRELLTRDRTAKVLSAEEARELLDQGARLQDALRPLVDAMQGIAESVQPRDERLTEARAVLCATDYQTVYDAACQAMHEKQMAEERLRNAEADLGRIRTLLYGAGSLPPGSDAIVEGVRLALAPRTETAVPVEVEVETYLRGVRVERDMVVAWLESSASGIEETMGKTQYSDAMRDAATGIRAGLHTHVTGDEKGAPR